jgi:hypothetical protein
VRNYCYKSIQGSLLIFLESRTLRQLHSWDPLGVSRDMFECLVETTDAMDEVRDVVSSFRSKVRTLDSGFVPCAWKQRTNIHGIVKDLVIFV